jgi:ribosomal protein L40E
MGAFETTRFYPGYVKDLTPVANDLSSYFIAKGYEVKKEQTITGGWVISIHKGGLFKSVIGMKTAMNIEIENYSNGTRAKAGIGIFGQQAIPTAISMLVFWPVLITQIWGLVQQSKLDDEAIECIERSLMSKVSQSNSPAFATAPSANSMFCTECGAKLQMPANFCPGCGMKVS